MPDYVFHNLAYLFLMILFDNLSARGFEDTIVVSDYKNIKHRL